MGFKLGVGGIVAALLLSAGPSAVAASEPASALVPAACLAQRAMAENLGASSRAVRAGVVRLYNRSVRVHPATINLSVSPVRSIPWATAYRSLVWLVPLAVDSYLQGDRAGRRLVAAYVVASWRTSKDPGAATPAARARAYRTGWNEATNRRRQDTLNCLVQIQPNATIRALLDASIRANLDPRRYAGLPYAHPHNHGLQANLTLIDSARILRRPTLITVAARRLVRDVRVVRDRTCGMVYEQSAHYQSVNARIWSWASRRLIEERRTAAARVLRISATHMKSALAHLVTPGGTLPAIGDGNEQSGIRPVPQDSLRMLCRAAGWVAGRTAWTSSATHYVLRFGPPTRMHGHFDHGSITWWPAMSVLADPGYYYDRFASLAAYARSNLAHNVLDVSGVEFTGATSLLRAAWRRGADTYTVRDSAARVVRTRSVRIDRRLPLLFVLDRASAPRTSTFTQRWHVATGWRRSATPGVVRRDNMLAGFVALDLRTGRFLPRATGSDRRFPTSRSTSRGTVLWTRQTARSVAIFTVVYRGAIGQRPVVRWYPGSRPGTGRVRVWWGHQFRDVRIDGIGIVTG
jgi:hypothetical protein